MQKGHWVILFLVFLIGSLVGYAVGYDVRANPKLEIWPEPKLMNLAESRELIFIAEVKRVEVSGDYFVVYVNLGQTKFTVEQKDFLFQPTAVVKEQNDTTLRLLLETAPFYPKPGGRIKIQIHRGASVIIAAEQNGFIWKNSSPAEVP